MKVDQAILILILENLESLMTQTTDMVLQRQ